MGQSADGSLSVHTMDLDRVTMMASDTHGSLLNRVYELQCLREKEQETQELTRQMAALTCHAHQEAELEEERFSQARARTDPVYILQQQHLQHQQQLEMQQQHMEMQQQDMEMQQHDVQQQLQQQQMEMQASHHYPSLVTHQQYCCTPQQL